MKAFQPRGHCPINLELDFTTAAQWGADILGRDRVTVAQPGLCSPRQGASPSLTVYSVPNSRVKGYLGRRVRIRPSDLTFPKNRK